MIYSLSGTLVLKRENLIVVEAGGVGYKLFVAENVAQGLPSIGSQVKVFYYLNLKQDGLELYGFASEAELRLFEKLISVNGVGPKSALGILSVSKIDQLVAAINGGKVELLTRASGVGKKTADVVTVKFAIAIAITLPRIIFFTCLEIQYRTLAETGVLCYKLMNISPLFRLLDYILRVFMPKQRAPYAACPHISKTN